MIKARLITSSGNSLWRLRSSSRAACRSRISSNNGSFKKDKSIELFFGAPVDEAWAKKSRSNYTVFEKTDPDIRIPVKSVELGPKRLVTVTLGV